MTLQTEPFDAAEYIDGPEEAAQFLTEALQSGDPAFIQHALGVVSRARGMSAVANDAGISRKGLYNAVGGDGDPKLSTVLNIFAALGLGLTAQPVKADDVTAR